MRTKNNEILVPASEHHQLFVARNKRPAHGFPRSKIWVPDIQQPQFVNPTPMSMTCLVISAMVSKRTTCLWTQNEYPFGDVVRETFIDSFNSNTD